MTNTAASLPYEQIIGTFMAVDKEDTSPPNHLRWIMQDRAGNAFRAVIFYGLTTNGHQLRRLDIVPQPGEEVIFCGKRREYKPVPYHGHNIVYEVDYLHYWDQHRSGWPLYPQESKMYSETAFHTELWPLIVLQGDYNYASHFCLHLSAHLYLNMSQVGDKIPEGDFLYIPYHEALEAKLACGVPKKMTTEDWKDKKVVLVGIPGAFTPTCHAEHLPEFLERADEIKSKGVDLIAILTANDAWVNSAWGIRSGITDKIVILSDWNVQWGKKLGLEVECNGDMDRLGLRHKRFAAVIDRGVISYLQIEADTDNIVVSGAKSLIEKL
ncbi:thioredoxin-dependent peroxidase [Planoprotostelium fungivorum]|uniref:Thioredoxin-dependent peroxidase n=1 Tax=Planoprotostelium fungivorum TaxID=1890364 RepID=A0A2P6N840_9EUKA|nr:thioredoxin-dependent peroxidase [Planoprotostelium fungivorum]